MTSILSLHSSHINNDDYSDNHRLLQVLPNVNACVVSFKKFAYYAGIMVVIPNRNFRLQYRAEFPIKFTLSVGYCKEIL